jgi:hypothetical protein
MPEETIFDPCLHLIQMMMLAFGRVICPEERDVSKVISTVSDKIGMLPLAQRLAMHPRIFGSEPVVHHGPSPIVDNGVSKKMVLPTKKCIKCGKEEMDTITKKPVYSAHLKGICANCKDAEADPITKKPKYKSMWFCGEQDDKTGVLIPGTGCGHIEKSEKHIVQWFTELNFDFQNANKQTLGIKTVTDEGLK